MERPLSEEVLLSLRWKKESMEGWNWRLRAWGESAIVGVDSARLHRCSFQQRMGSSGMLQRSTGGGG